MSQSKSAAEEKDNLIKAPTISLPKGGGAIRGIGEKFGANPVTGTGSMSVPLATSPGRSGFGPQLALSYDSGSGNGPFGLGWSLSIPSISRKTDKGLPRYQDNPPDAKESDVFILSGAEDLVPLLTEKEGSWQVLPVVERTVANLKYHIQQYRPRIEGLFARIERWTNLIDSTDVFWRSISKDNVTTWYGKTAESRILDPDPEGKARIFSWLLCETYDDKGNVIVYGYKAEDGEGIDLGQAHERNRGVRPDDVRRRANRYIKHIRYGNRTPYQPSLSESASWPTPLAATASDASKDWLFEVVFDYGEHQSHAPTPVDNGVWTPRNDPFSTYRAGFEIRTYRLCQRVLMFHHFPAEPEVGANCLVRSTDFNYSFETNSTNARIPVFSVLRSVTQCGYVRDGKAYLKKSMPPLEFGYTEATVENRVRDVDPVSLENLPYGIDGHNYQWVDLDGEGLSGVLTEQAGAWWYKRNRSPLTEQNENGSRRTIARLDPLEVLASKPTASLASGSVQLMDLAGDGQIDVVEFSGQTPGFFERNAHQGWDSFTPFRSMPDLPWQDPHLKFLDLTGDGHADVLISEDHVFTWYPSLAEEGFGQSKRSVQSFDEESGPTLICADAEQTIYLADMSGDGLTDLVRIRNGEVCYWPNVGYGRFGARVTMDNSPWFDCPEQFDQKRIRLADIDGSGTSDIIYLHGDGVRLYFNQSGNSWSSPPVEPSFPRIDPQSSVSVLDLLGNGTACLVWSSSLPGSTQRQMRYVDLMGGQKPHLLTNVINNLGAETRIEYAPSTKFYVQDLENKKPWNTKLPFPVHCVEKVIVTDKWRKTTFSTTYSYHHGYFDGVDREFRGFGRVEQIDVEDYGKFSAGNSNSPYITDDHALYQPPVKTVTWYHTGAFLDRERILSQFKKEYFPHWFEALKPEDLKLLGTFKECDLPEPDLDSLDLSAAEWREALRACKGMMLRQEVFEMSVDRVHAELVQDHLTAMPGRPSHRPVKIFSAASHNCRIARLQPQAENRHAVFHVTESEAITYHYELELGPNKDKPDPRIAHTINVRFDEYGNLLQSVAAVYPRLETAAGPLFDGIAEEDRARLREVQSTGHLVYTETRYTRDVVPTQVGGGVTDPDIYRLRIPCEALTYDLTGFQAKPGFYFTLHDFVRFRLSLHHQSFGDAVEEILYHQISPDNTPKKRLVEHVRMLFFQDDLSGPLPLRELGRLGLPYETYKLALTDDLLNAVFVSPDGNKLDSPASGPRTAREFLQDANVSGYLSASDAGKRFGGDAIPGQYWIRSGIAGFADDAKDHFYLPEEYTDPFGNKTSLAYDGQYDLFIQSTIDMLRNKTELTRFDYRVLAPREMKDINDNLSEVVFDVLGLPTAMALKGKGKEGDDLADITQTLISPSRNQLTEFFVKDKPYDQSQAKMWLGHATARHVYYFGETEEKLSDGTLAIRWGQHPACACGILREQHISQLAKGDSSPVQCAFEFSDGMGSVLMKKVQAEPDAVGHPLRWVASGKTILNNKGKPVKQYEPYFSVDALGHPSHQYDEPTEEGATLVMFYDALGRTVRTEMPDGSFSRVEFSPWHVHTFDQNDTVKESQWYADRNPLNPDQALPRDPLTGDLAVTLDQRAAWLAAQHADTPTLTILDSLGRNVIVVTHNKTAQGNGEIKDEKYLTFTKLDAEGKPLWIRDARKNLVMQYIAPPVPSDQAGDPVRNFVPCYDIAGNLLFQHSMDAGDRWMLNDSAGKPMLAWDNRGHMFRTDYDALHRPVTSFVTGANSADSNREIQYEKLIYGDTSENGLTDAQKVELNVRGKLYQHFDTAGIVISTGRNNVTDAEEGFDFKGNLLRSTRQLVKDYKNIPDWTKSPVLEKEIFSNSVRYDALNRPIQLVAPHGDQPGVKYYVTRPGYNAANLLEQVNVWLHETTEPSTLLDPATATLNAVTNIDYDAKGQRTRIEYNEDNLPIITGYTYDKTTFRLTRLLTTRPQHPEEDKRRLQDLSYTYDPIGNITDIHDAAQQTVFFNNATIKASNAYMYDSLYRLTQAEGREHAAQNNVQRDSKSFEPISGIPFPNSPEALQRYIETYDYDSVGNILGMHHRGGSDERWVRWYQYALNSNRLIATSLPGDRTNLPAYTATAGYRARYSHDAHGNMTVLPHLPTMEWDFKDRLHATQRQVVQDGEPGEKTYYNYDASGERVRKITESSHENRRDESIYLVGFEIVRKYTSSSEALTFERETLHVMDDKQRIALIETRTLDKSNNDLGPLQLIRYQIGNSLGSTVAEVDEETHLISYEEYHPYGTTAYEAMRSKTDTAKRYRYTCKERDEESGFAYHGARYYIPSLTRWASCDSFLDQDVMNRYLYVKGNPISKVDLNGKWETDMHFLAVYWAGRMQGATHIQSKSAAIASQSLDDNEKTTAPGLKIPGDGEKNRLANNSHALGISKGETEAVAMAGVKEQNTTLFGLGLHPVGDYLPHANLSGVWSAGHQMGYNEDFSQSDYLLHDADYTYKNPMKALATFEAFKGMWSKYLSQDKSSSTLFKEGDSNLEMVKGFIFAMNDDFNAKESAFSRGLKAIGAEDFEINEVLELFRSKSKRSEAMIGRAATTAHANEIWRSLNDNKRPMTNRKVNLRSELAGVATISTPEFKQRRARNLILALQGKTPVPTTLVPGVFTVRPDEEVFSPR